MSELEKVVLPETFTTLPGLPSWECIINCQQNKRQTDFISIHAGLFNTLWSESGQCGSDQGNPQSQIHFDNIKNQSSRHGNISLDIAEWLWPILTQGTLRKMRFSTGKYLDSNMIPKYDNWVDVDVSLVLEDRKFGHLVLLIDKMLNYNRKFTKYLQSTIEELSNGNKIRTIQS